MLYCVLVSPLVSLCHTCVLCCVDSATTTSDLEPTRTNSAEMKVRFDVLGLGRTLASWPECQSPGAPRPRVRYCPGGDVRARVACCHGTSSPREPSPSLEKK